VLPGQTFTPKDFLAIFLRRRWLILLPFALGLAAAPLIAKQVPKVYRSETLITVIAQRVPDSYVKSTITATVADRLPAISDQILSRSRLERIIQDFDLYDVSRASGPMEDAVRRMRADVGPVSIRTGEQSFRVGYTSQDPRNAQKVAARLASLFIEENSRDRENTADSTNVFIESQLEDAKQRLVTHEQKLEVFRRMHAGELPTQLESNLRAISTAQLQLQSVSESLNRARERRLLVERQAIDAQTLPVTLAQPLGPSNAPDAQASLSSSQQLELAEARLEALRLRYTAEHPEVRGMERSIRELKGRVAEEARRPATAVDRTPSPAEQARQKRIRDLQADMDVIDHQLSTGQAEEARLKALIADYQRKVEAVPGRESELVELTRDYDILKKTYDSLLTKREDSKLAANLERRQIGEQFRILDPASLPSRPANQILRLALSLAGGFVGLALGLLLAAVLEYRDSSFAREEDVARLLTLPVLALVPAMTSEVDRRRARVRSLLADVAAIAVVVGSTAILLAWGLAQR
jgi:polysaccharide chain length determinant protein (PEP-CTERM system associated)